MIYTFLLQTPVHATPSIFLLSSLCLLLSILHRPQQFSLRMRIRKSVPNSPLSHSPSSSSSSSFSSPSLTANSLASSTDSSSSAPFPFPSPSSSPARCRGLDLLVKAIHQVTAGSAVGFPYIQKRVVRRRRRAICFDKLSISQVKIAKPTSSALGKERRRRSMAVPSKFQDSVLQSWRPKSMRSVKVLDS